MAKTENNIILPDDMPETAKTESELNEWEKGNDGEKLPDHLKKCLKCKKIKHKNKFKSERYRHACITCVLVHEPPEDSLDYGRIAHKRKFKENFYKDIMDKAKNRETKNEKRVRDIAALAEDN